MENTLDNIVNEIVTASNDRIYTNLLDAGLDPALAYESAFNSDGSFVEDIASDGVTAEDLEAEEAWLPNS